MIKVVIYEKGENKLCYSCKYGYGIILDSALEEAHICFLNCKDNEGEFCPKYKKRDNENRDKK